MTRRTLHNQKRTLKQTLRNSIDRDPFTTLWPRKYGRKAFYVKIPGHAVIRVYKVKYLFSSVGGVCMIDFYISRSNVKKTAKLNWVCNRSFGFDLKPEQANNVIQNLKRYGLCRIC